MEELKKIILKNSSNRLSTEELNKVSYKISLSTKNNEPAVRLIKIFRNNEEELFCHILRKENSELFEDLFRNDKITLDNENRERFNNAINNAFDKVDKQIRTKLKNEFFDIKISFAMLKTKEINLIPKIHNSSINLQ